MVKARKWVLLKNFVGTPKKEDMELVEFDLPDKLEENEVLLEAVYLSVDPYMRPYTAALKTPVDMIGEQLSKVVQSRNDKFPVGTLVLSQVGWRSHYISNGQNIRPISFDLKGTSSSHCLGALGMPGATAYFGFNHLLSPKSGEIIVVNGAAGAVGSIVGQLAKIKGLTVIAFAGDDNKVDLLKNELGFDHVFNYKKVNFSEAISKVAPQGVDLFFDNVGGDWYDAIINKHLRKYGRATICGSIETYNSTAPKLYPLNNFAILRNELKINGILVQTFYKDWPVAFAELNQYIQDGRLKVRETVYEGFEKMQEAFHGLFIGENTGKAIVKVGSDTVHL